MKLINDLKVEKIEMYNLKLVSDHHDDVQQMQLPPSSSAEGKMVCHRCIDMSETCLGILYRKETEAGYNQMSSMIYRQEGTNFGRQVNWRAYSDEFCGFHGRRGAIFHQLGRTVSNIPKPEHSKLILPDEIVVVPIRELSYNNAKKEISDYIKKAGDRKVYISELAEELVIDFELIEEIMEELEMYKRD